MGGTGYAAAELIKRLLTHPHVELMKIGSIDHIGENVGQVHRNFRNRLPYVFENLSPAELSQNTDVIFLALPHGVSFQKAPEFFPHHVRLIDLSGDYRIKDVNTYNKYYHTTHSNPENIPSFVYGLPELYKEKIRTATRIANPGCFPTGVILGVLPLAKAGLLKGKIRVVGATGSSGSGVKPQEGTHHPIRSLNIKSYKMLDHQHQPEMEQTISDAGGENISVDFIPVSAPFSRGMLLNTIVDLPEHVTEKEIIELYKSYYKDAPFVRILEKGSLPEAITVAGTNFAEIGFFLKSAQNGTRSFAVSVAIDNLVKGASGQAIQNMNLMFGLEETTGLEDFGSWP
jgi:N-acetyl-gamma-glutamyl-phosphate reductase